MIINKDTSLSPDTTLFLYLVQVAQLVQALRYKPKGRGFDTR